MTDIERKVLELLATRVRRSATWLGTQVLGDWRKARAIVFTLARLKSRGFVQYTPGLHWRITDAGRRALEEATC